MTRTANGTPAVWAFAEHEHRELERGINRMHDVACQIGHRPTPDLATDVQAILDWFGQILEPHIAWEEGWLYPELDDRIGTPWVTRVSHFDHQQIRRMALDLRADQALLGSRAPGDRGSQVQCRLFGLEALIRAHLEREERFLIPLLSEDAWIERARPRRP
ncbi:MAG: hemerythrin domain-containing protein [Candidatus Limnocylindrales bacterium]